MPEFILVGLVLVCAVAMLLRRDSRGNRQDSARGWVVRLAALGLVVAVARAAIWYANSHDAHAQATYLKDRVPAVANEHGYVSSAACQSCHPGHFATWHATYHRTMTQTATPDAVVGDFDNHRVAFDGVDYLLFRRGNGYWARVTPQAGGQAAPSQEVQLVMTTGSHHYQVYWTNENPDRSLIEFPLAWLIEDRRWIPREAALVMPPHLKQQAVLWNGVCVRCHSTHSQPRMESGSQRADTSVAELGISCEACHGPAEAHIKANQNPARRYERHVAGTPDETIVNPSRLSAERSSQVCGHCHAIASFGQQDWWRGHWNAFRPGADLHATRHVIRPNEQESLVDLREALKANPDYLIGHYWRDGMVRVSGREYNGLIESPCYEGGKFGCLSCHSMHDSDPNDQLSAGMLGDRACLQCHDDFRDRVAEHSHHAADSAGSRCYNCHMPHTTYGLLKAIRSHQVSSPLVPPSVKTGRPNACNQCHLDKSLGWTQKHLAAWYGTPQIKLDEDHDKVSSLATMLLRGDAGQRALAAWSMGWPDAHAASGGKWQAPYLAQLLEDPYPAVRYIAVRSLRRLSGNEKFEYDFVGPADARQAAHRRAVDLWDRSREQRLGQTGDAILIDANGHLDRAAFERLLKQRDDRDIDLKESSKRPKSPDQQAEREEPSQRVGELELLASRHLRFGWWALLVFLSLGIALELLHGFKVEWYLDRDHATRRHMWTLAHAHGTLLSLIHLALAASIPRLNAGDLRWRHIASPCLYSATLTLPAGFFLGGLYIYSGDPGVGILLVPVGGFLLLIAVWLIALAAKKSAD